MTDTELLNWLESACGASLVCDDNGRWAVTGSGFQNLDDKDGNLITDQPIDIESTFWVSASEWKPTIREAIEAAVKEWVSDSE